MCMQVMPVKLRSVMSMLSHHTTSTSGGRSMCPVEQSTYWATTVDFDGPLPTAAAPASSNCKLDALHAQLNSISSDVAVLERFSLLGANQRRQGGAPRLKTSERPVCRRPQSHDTGQTVSQFRSAVMFTHVTLHM